MLTILEGFGILLLRSVSCEAPGVPVVAQSAAPEPVTCEKLSDFSSQSTMQAGGWSLHNLNEGSYGDVFRRWGSSGAVGKLTTTLVGEGTMTLVLRNDYTTTAAHNHVKVLLNGDELASLSGKEEKTVHISFVDGDQLTILEGFGILLLRSVSCEAPGVAQEAPAYCLSMVTGTGRHNDGTVKITLDAGLGSAETVAGGMFSNGQSVFSHCYSNPIAWVEVQNPTSNAWTGSIQYSTDSGETFDAMVCSKGCNSVASTSKIVVDGNSDGGGQASLTCLGGAACRITAKTGPYCLSMVT